jgi:uncharacterized transporter YbjL
MVAMCIPLYGSILVYSAISLAIQQVSMMALIASVSIGFLLGSVAVVWAHHRFVPLIRKDA